MLFELDAVNDNGASSGRATSSLPVPSASNSTCRIPERAAETIINIGTNTNAVSHGHNEDATIGYMLSSAALESDV